jgi:hypothetical protein
MKVKDKFEMPSNIPNKAEIPILNHRDDGEMKAIKSGDECKVFSFKTAYELQLKYGFKSYDVAIAEDYFWTCMPFMVDGHFDHEDNGKHDMFDSCVVASTWGTPCVITPEGKAYACYTTVPRDEFPGVYLKNWDTEFFKKQYKDVIQFFVGELKKIIDGEV